ncbi:hypothetical protein PAHAL_2G145300 [Panicum hallii]|uniref:Uncharacterized protein n=1 Tax=Panicum hallii TaxID=206008 RepID=A0A2T8KP19_9POAL|nr:hypothetical protein PAHAL_2G145300 [Panicum hallii]PVH63955.1 hypothetical protein PAHAL_2G145300 [Panicum hallii]
MASEKTSVPPHSFDGCCPAQLAPTAHSSSPFFLLPIPVHLLPHLHRSLSIVPGRAQARALRRRPQVVGRHRLPPAAGPDAAPHLFAFRSTATHPEVIAVPLGGQSGSSRHSRARDAGSPDAAEGDPQDGVRGPVGPHPIRAAMLADTRAAAGAGNLSLAALVESGALVLVPRRRLRPVPAWRPPDFMEPEEVWILSTSHLSPESVVDVESVLRAVQPDNVDVELCRSWQELGS